MILIIPHNHYFIININTLPWIRPIQKKITCFRTIFDSGMTSLPLPNVLNQFWFDLTVTHQLSSPVKNQMMSFHEHNRGDPWTFNPSHMMRLYVIIKAAIKANLISKPVRRLSLSHLAMFVGVSSHNAAAAGLCKHSVLIGGSTQENLPFIFFYNGILWQRPESEEGLSSAKKYQLSTQTCSESWWLMNMKW